MKKINSILNELDKMAKTALKMQRGYDSNRITLPKKMEEFLHQGYFGPWDYFTEKFYDIFNKLNKSEQEVFIKNIFKHTALFSCVKAGFHYNAPRIYEDWYSPVIESDYFYNGEFHPDEYEAALEEEQHQLELFANTDLKKDYKLLQHIIREGTWTAACPGHRKVLRMKHHPW